jgi:N-acetylglucosamine-6-phosphate deacetylase
VRKLLYNARLLTERGLWPSGWLLIEEGIIRQIGQDAPPSTPDAGRIDLQGSLLAPGLIDVHVHGALGMDVMDADPEALRQMARFYAQHGVTSFLATTTTDAPDRLLAAVKNVAQVMAEGTGGAELLGTHVEGPYIDQGRRGAQDPAHIRAPQPDEYRRLFDTGAVRLITVAPEAPQVDELIAFALEHGAAVSIGHTRASYELVRHVVELGANQATHLFNGMEPLHHRDPGVVGAALTLDDVYCQLIADNVHIHPAVLKLAVRAKGTGRILLITDAMRGAGMPDGEYNLGGLAVTVLHGEARLPDGTLAGSTLTLDRALVNIMAATGLSLMDVLPMATANPARALNMPQKGVIAEGKDADLIVLDDQARVMLTFVGGETVYRR